MTWYAGNNSTNNGSLGWLFEASGGGGVTVNVTGVSATSQVGSVTVRANASGFVQSFNVPSVQTALLEAAVNTNPGKALFRDVVLSGRMLGDIDNSGTIISFDSVLYGRWGFGSPLAVPADNTYIETVLNEYMTQNPVAYAAYLSFGYGQVGSATVAAKGTVAVTGVSAIGQIGSVSVGTSQTIAVNGVAATGEVGSVVVSINAVVDLTGVSASGLVGSVVVTADAVVTPTGVSATGQTGTVTVLVVVPVTGVQGTTVLGTITLESNNYLDVTGLQATTSIGTVTLTGVWSNPDDEANVWTNVVPSSDVWTPKATGSNTWTTQ